MHPQESMVRGALAQIRAAVERADQAFYDSIHTGNEDWELANVEWNLVTAYSTLSVLAHALELSSLAKQIEQTFHVAATDGLTRSGRDPNGDPYLKWAGGARQFSRVIESVFVLGEGSVTRELEAVLRASGYTLCDQRVFPGPPVNERQVQDRVEALLRPWFPDLVREPHIAGTLKSSRGDTGLPSIRTLIEYKYLKTEQDVPLITEQIMADTRGYFSADWSTLIFVIYEAGRFRPERAWETHLRQKGVPSSVKAVVINGEAAKDAQELPTRRRSGQVEVSRNPA